MAERWYSKTRAVLARSCDLSTIVSIYRLSLGVYVWCGVVVVVVEGGGLKVLRSGLT